MSLETLGVFREEPTEFHLRRSGPSASLLRRQSGGLTSRGCSPPGLQAVSGLCQPPETWGSASLKQASRSLTCWRVAIGEETELHEHDCFSTQTLPGDASTSARFRPGLQGAQPGFLQSLGPTSARLCAACGGLWTMGVGTAALHPHTFLLSKPHRLFFHFTDLVSLGLSLHMIPFYHFCGLSEEPTVSLV